MVMLNMPEEEAWQIAILFMQLLNPPECSLACKCYLFLFFEIKEATTAGLHQNALHESKSPRTGLWCGWLSYIALMPLSKLCKHSKTSVNLEAVDHTGSLKSSLCWVS